MMNIALLGATGKFGRKFTAKLLTNPNNNLTLLSKSAGDIFGENPWIKATNIDAKNLKDLEKSLKDMDIVFCVVSGSDQPDIAKNLVEVKPKRLIYMSVVGIYNELAKGNGDEFNVDNEEEQIPNRDAVAVIENSDLDYTILRAGYLIYGDENEYVITKKGETAKGYISHIESIEKVALEIIGNPKLYSHESISITKDMS
jgi:uncharacterized protein YbjT (DUF2867 family)